MPLDRQIKQRAVTEVVVRCKMLETKLRGKVRCSG